MTGLATSSRLFSPGLAGVVVGDDVLYAQVRMDGAGRLTGDQLPSRLARCYTPGLGENDLEVLDPRLLLG